MMGHRGWAALTGTGALLLASAVSYSAGARQLPFQDTGRPAAERAHDLVRRMTLEEKASQMQQHAIAIPHLQLPVYYWWSEALHGVVSMHSAATVFPEPIGLAASFDPDLVRRMGDAIAIEGRIRHREALRDRGSGLFEGLTFYSPNINLFRDPRWGRGQETYGEDPLLTAQMGVAVIEGLQGDDLAHPKVVATAKHFAVHSGPEPLRHVFDARVSAHDLEDSYLPAFRAAVVDGHVASVMCVYNAVDGVPGCASSRLLNETLRRDWGFKGFVVSDCDAVTDISAHHHYAADTVSARALAVRAGMDNECTASPADFGAPVPTDARPAWRDYLDAVQQGKLGESDLDQALERSLRWRFALGLLDPPGSSALDQLPAALADSDAHRALALQAARESMVLLKDTGTLPLDPGTRRIAVVGPLADQHTVLVGNYAGTPSRSTSILEGIRVQFPAATVNYARGSDFPGEPPPVPAAWLTTAEGQAGLKAEYYADATVAGTPFLTRVDPTANLSAASGPPPGSPPTRYTVRWTGQLTPAESGTYELGLGGEFCVLWLDGKALVDKRGAPLQGPKMATVELKAGQVYAIEIQSYPGFIQSAQLLGSRVATAAQLTERALEAARSSDVIVAVVGITSQLEGEESAVDLPGFKGGDRSSLDLPAQEQTLLEALKSTGKPLVVVLMNGSALSVNWAAAHADAILEAWYPGEEGGTAVAETLAGLNNPAGRLPVTFYKGADQLPAFDDYAMANRTYRYFTGDPLYAFGFGLSYTRFAYSELRLSTHSVAAGQPLTASVQLRNTGDRDGDEVVQLYLEFPKVDGAPLRALRAFQRVHLRRGESRRVQLALAARELAHVDLKGRHVITGGRYRLTIGGGQPAPGSAAADFSIAGDLALPR
jgi:beta-glucosidase